jgi:hypothetical protein
MAHFPHQERLSLLRKASFRYVTRDLGCADNVAFRIADGRNYQRYIDERSILATTTNLKMVDALASLDPREDNAAVILLEAADDLLE